MTRVAYLDEDPAGLAAMLGGLLEANLDAHPDRARLLRRGLVGIVARDAGVAVTIHLAPGRITLANGLVGRPSLVVETDAETLAELSSVPLRLGLPDPATPAGRRVLAGLGSGRLRVRGLVRSLPLLARLNRLLAVS